jgi:hypothetical protein
MCLSQLLASKIHNNSRNKITKKICNDPDVYTWKVYTTLYFSRCGTDFLEWLVSGRLYSISISYVCLLSKIAWKWRHNGWPLSTNAWCLHHKRKLMTKEASKPANCMWLGYTDPNTQIIADMAVSENRASSMILICVSNSIWNWLKKRKHINNCTDLSLPIDVWCLQHKRKNTMAAGENTLSKNGRTFDSEVHARFVCCYLVTVLQP